MFFVVSLLSAQTPDVAIWGFKGMVMNAKITSDSRNYGSYSFGVEGNVSGSVSLWSASGNELCNLQIAERTKKGFTGESNYGKVKATVTNNRIAKLEFTGEKNNNKSTYTVTYTYDNTGNLIKVNEVYVYYVEEGIEYGSNVYGVDNYYNEIEAAANQYVKDIKSNPLNAVGAANRASKRIGRAANGVGVNSYAKVKKSKKTIKAECLYSNYVFDEVGNWTARTCQKDNNKFTQYQTIKYEPNYYSQFLWSRLEKEGDLNKIEAFYNNSETTEKYKDLASEYWNERILNEVAEKYENDLDELCLIVRKTIVNEDVKEQALAIVRADMYNNVVLKERDYAKVLHLCDLKRQGIEVFDDYYKQLISAYSNKLKADLILGLLKKAKQEFKSNDFPNAIATSKKILSIDPTNKQAADICQEASYQIVKLKEADKSVKELDYELFVESYPYSSHITEMQNSRALYASSLFNKYTSLREIDRVESLPCDANTRKKVAKRCKKWRNREIRGRFVHVGLGGNFALGTDNSSASGELLLQLGYATNVVNFVTGVKVNYLSKDLRIEGSDPYFSKRYLSVPAMLRFIVAKRSISTYLGIGTDISIGAYKSGFRGYVTDNNGDYKRLKIDDKAFANRGLVFTPTISLGISGRFLELELFANYDLGNHFDANYIKDYKLDSGKKLTLLYYPKDLKNEVDNNGFRTNFRAGLAFRIWI